MSYKAVLFDLDGTLLDTIEDLADAMNVALVELGFAPKTVQECKFLVGDGRDAFARGALPADSRGDDTVARCVELLTAEYERNWAVKTRAYDGIEAMLAELVHRGLKIAILSNKWDESVHTMVGHFFTDAGFELVRGARATSPLKPDPTAAMEVAEQLAVLPEQFLYLGDTATDMKTATAAGMFAVGALWGFRPAEELSAAGADRLIEQPGQLLELA